MRGYLTALATLALCAFSNLCAAGAITFSFEGEVDVAELDNPFDLVIGDAVAVTGMFDDIFTGVGDETVAFGLGTGNTLQIIAGSKSFDQTDDGGYASGDFPAIVFADGALVTFDFLSGPGVSPYFQGSDPFPDLYFSGFGIAGHWIAGPFLASRAATAVPEPGTWTLLGAGLLGLAISRLRKRRTAIG